MNALVIYLPLSSATDLRLTSGGTLMFWFWFTNGVDQTLSVNGIPRLTLPFGLPTGPGAGFFPLAIRVKAGDVLNLSAESAVLVLAPG